MKLGSQVKLSKDPIVEALLEIRFTPIDSSSAHLIAGLVYSRVRKEFAEAEMLGVSQMPFEIRMQDPNLRYNADQRFRSKDGFVLSIGPRVMALSCVKPYQHWEAFFPRIMEMTNMLKDLEVVKKIDRIGLRYINFLNHGDTPLERSKQLRVASKLGDMNLFEKNTQIRTEFDVGEFHLIVHVITNAVPEKGSDEEPGIILDIDTICSSFGDDFWSTVEGVIDKAHDVEREFFFEALSESAFERLK